MSTGAELTLERPQADELDDLNALILRSKAVWGYDAAFMRACETELEVTSDLLQQNQFMTATLNGRVLGMAEVSLEGPIAYLEKLFIDPDHMKSGAGRLLFQWARQTAADAGAQKMIIEADPDAEPFYLKMGAQRTGLVPSGSIPGRMLPELALWLNQSNAGT